MIQVQDAGKEIEISLAEDTCYHRKNQCQNAIHDKQVQTSEERLRLNIIICIGEIVEIVC
jgi:hypothetical protein